jgi:ParB/RepB/Spo0J family partition protein
MIRLEDIFVNPERQREDKDISDLLPSIRARGLIQPLVVEISGGGFTLIAGERRYLCAKALGLTEVPARLFSSLLPVEREILELEENLHRKDLHWKELAKSVHKIHFDHKRLALEWTQAQTAQSINFKEASTSALIAVGEELLHGKNKQIEEASGWSTAYNVITRRNQRRADDVFNELMEEKEEPRGSPVSSTPSTRADPVEEPRLLPRPIEDTSPIRCCDFLLWLDEYRGPPFTFLHCDFPYGIGLDRSDQAASATWGGYEDSEDTYWRLIQAFTSNLDKLMAPSSHLMFWLSSDHSVITNTVQCLHNQTNLIVNPKPLIWHKSDNRGILPDPKRGPRHVYETAIFASRGDRFVHQSVVDAYSSPAGDKTHQSEKSESMLRHFFRMFLDEGTSFLDPTCGTGSSLRAAHSLGATVTGLEINREHCEVGNALFRKYLNLRRYE